MTFRSRAFNHIKATLFGAAFWTVAGQIASACDEYQVNSTNQRDPVKSAIASLEADSLFAPGTDFGILQVTTIKDHKVDRRLQQARVSRRIEFENCLTLRKSGMPEDQRQAALKSLQEQLYSEQGFARIHSTTSGETLIKVAALGADARFIGKQAQFTETRYLWESPYVLTDGNKHFVIVASVLDGNAAIAQANRLKRRNPELDFAVYAPYFANPYHGIMMAAWVDLPTAREALAIARQSIAPDSYIWSCQSDGRFC